MTARQDILNSIRRNLPQAVELPALDGPWIQYDDPIAKFQSVLEFVGGELFQVGDVSAIPALLGEWLGPEKAVVSCVPGVCEDRFRLTTVDDPHQLEHVDLAILPGQVAIAENAAVWVDDRQVSQRVLFFLCQHLALVVPRSQVVSNMYEAYQLIDPAKRPFGCFISGPSKTADIEQSLVKGAHGARTIKIFLVETL